jgi:hypothetical protein
MKTFVPLWKHRWVLLRVINVSENSYIETKTHKVVEKIKLRYNLPEKDNFNGLYLNCLSSYIFKCLMMAFPKAETRSEK